MRILLWLPGVFFVTRQQSNIDFSEYTEYVLPETCPNRILGSLGIEITFCGASTGFPVVGALQNAISFHKLPDI